MSLDDLKELDIDTLVELLLCSQQSRERIALCINIGIDHKRLNYLENTSERDFFIRLIDDLNETGNNDALCKLCCKELLPILPYQQNRNLLENIIEKLGCNQSIIVQKPIPIFPKKRIFLFISTFFLIVLTTIGFSNYNQKSPPITLQNSPAMAVFEDKLYIAFKANDASNQLFVASSEDGTFPKPARGYSSVRMGGSPAMAVFKDKLYIAFKANDASNQLFVASFKDGTFSAPAIGYSSVRMGGNPAMAVFKDKLYIAFKANDASNQLFVASSEDGTFSAPAIGYSSVRMRRNPAMAVFKDKLYIAFKANDASNQLFVASSEDGTFSAPAIGYKAIQMGDNPAMAVFKDKLYIAFKANDESNRLCLARFKDGTFASGC
jgi:hypothetical protein